MSSRMFGVFFLISLLVIPGESEPNSYLHTHTPKKPLSGCFVSISVFKGSLCQECVVFTVLLNWHRKRRHIWYWYIPQQIIL